MQKLEEIWGWVTNFAKERIVAPILNMDAWDVIDVLLLAFILFSLYRFTRNRRAGRVLFGLGAVVAFSILVVLLELPALSYIVRLFAASAFFCIIVIFQPEIRDALEDLGNTTFLNPRSDTLSRKKMDIAKSVAEETVDAVVTMSKSRTGALIVFEGLTKLGDYIKTGRTVDAKVTSVLLQNIFFDHAPLHDGALIIRNMRILAANCVLPSTHSTMDFGSMGMRHRAAVGVTEYSDALVVVVSEQTGTISVAQEGKLLRDVDGKTLYDILMTYMAGNAYLRVKRANMRKEYLEMLENVGKVAPIVREQSEPKKINPEFNAPAEDPVSAVDVETDSSLEKPITNEKATGSNELEAKEAQEDR